MYRRPNIQLKKLGVVKNQSEKEEFLSSNSIFQQYNAYELEGVVRSLRVPQNERIKKRIETSYAEVLEDEDNVIKAREIVENIPVPFLYFKTAYHMYSKFLTVLWNEDGLVKALQFFFSRCPSGGCDGESIHLLVAVDLDDLFSMFYHQHFEPADKEKIAAALIQITNLQEESIVATSEVN